MNDMKTPITDESVKTTDWASGESVVNAEDMRALEIKYNEALLELTILKRQTELGDLLSEANNNEFNELSAKHSEMFRELNVYKEDLKQAAGELMLPLPKPGSDMARVCVVNRVLKNKIQKLESEMLNLANGDKLLPEASNNALIIEECIQNLNDKINFANDVLEEVKGAAHSRALLGGSPDEYLGALLKVSSLAGQGLVKLRGTHE